MARHALAPCCYIRTSSVHLDHNPRDDKGKAGCTDKLPSHRIVIPEMARGINRSTLKTRTTEGAPIHVGSLDPH
ncbi:hypothetical protein BHE74_00031062 [Ensete ventricosum]|nr:hypothetical protein BHE74_00031062 [Ensete ventricosum]RZS10043.1 hypothetical protein BHM03_00041194 [Ensete ventricosum]